MIGRSPTPGNAFLHRLADAADAETLPRFRTALTVDSKSLPGEKFDPVTDADRAAEHAMREIILSTYPSHGIWGEETGTTEGDGRHNWVLDPVDGTRPFLCGIPVWATLIGLMVGSRASIGIMSQPFTGERFWATTEGSWHSRNGDVRHLRTRTPDDLSTATLHTTSPICESHPTKAGFERLRNAVRLTRYGGEAYAAAMLAAGLIDLCFEPSLQPYDIVALIPIIEQAGGIVSNLNGDRAEAGGAVLMSGSAHLHEIALRFLSQQ